MGKDSAAQTETGPLDYQGEGGGCAFDGSLRCALALMDALRPRILRALRPTGLPPADLDDVVQVTLTEVALGWDEQLATLSVSELSGWVLRTAHLRALDAVRHRERQQQREEQFGSVPPSAPLDPETTFLRNRQRAAYVNALHRLPAPLREPLALSVTQELTCRQIAGVLGLPVGTVKTRLRRARALCRTR
jgi:RNA polymerase sigma-70 factor (ECF subfamily)